MATIEINLMKQIRASAEAVKAALATSADLSGMADELRSQCIVMKSRFINNLRGFVETHARLDASGWLDAEGKPDLTEARDRLEDFGAVMVIHRPGLPTLFRFHTPND
jgi:hypothetical protein